MMGTEEKLGIDVLQKGVGLVIGTLNKVDEVTQDGWQTLQDSISLFPTLVEVPWLITHGREVVAQAKDVDAVESETLMTFVQDNFDLEDDKLEVIVEKSLKLLKDAASLVALIKKAKRK